ncbi:hypothetical protein [Streptomyces sp. NPDC057939]|uniref:hypothetical protein n=1 Tax=Streptomyces sp. NPDC057939 TaxID=3346284 RepID=UPI0036E21B6F
MRKPLIPITMTAAKEEPWSTYRTPRFFDSPPLDGTQHAPFASPWDMDRLV